MKTPSRVAWVVGPLLGLACLGSPTEPELVIRGEGKRALFVGNSYLYLMDIPGVVKALADSAGGERIAVAMVTGPDMALVDHWRAGPVQTHISRGGWEWVVLQQGPSSTAVNRDSLRLMAQTYAALATSVSAKTALFSAWPSEARMQDFPRAIESYQLAAADVDGTYLPVAAAWLRAWELEPGLILYSDGLHPSQAGAYLSALVVYACLLGKSPIGLPRQVQTSQRAIAVSELAAPLLQQAALDVARASCGLP